MVDQEHNSLDQLYERLDDNKLQHPLSGRTNETDTIGSRLAHLIGAEYRMATYLYQQEDDIEDFAVDGSSLADIMTKSDQAKARHQLTLDHLNMEDLGKTWTSERTGKEYEYKFLLWHFVEHIATHRGQVTMTVNGLDA